MELLQRRRTEDFPHVSSATAVTCMKILEKAAEYNDNSKRSPLSKLSRHSPLRITSLPSLTKFAWLDTEGNRKLIRRLEEAHLFDQRQSRQSHCSKLISSARGCSVYFCRESCCRVVIGGREGAIPRPAIPLELGLITSFMGMDQPGK